MVRFSIAVDAMGGDHGPSVVVPAVLAVLAQRADVAFILVGDEAVLSEQLRQRDATRSHVLRIHHASQSIAMDESPAHALRYKKESSMRIAMELVKEGQAQACVSAGNTGALMAVSRFVLKMLPGIDRPAIINALPTKDPHFCVRILDLGANVDCTAEQLEQFALMGSVLASEVDGIPHPKVALLNIGVEEIKGNELVKQAAQRLAAHRSLNYVGFIEADDIYNGKVDVVVCDGFVGNVLLKGSEGIAKFIFSLVKEMFQTNLLTRCLGAMIKPFLKRVHERIDPASYGGATLIGLQKTVIKCHGGSDATTFKNAFLQAIVEVEKRVPEKVGEYLQPLFAE